MKEVKMYQNTLKAIAILTAILVAYQCHSQTRFNTGPGLIEIADSNNPDELCVRFGDKWGSVSTENLRYAGEKITRRIAAAAKMADDAGVNYSTFLKENQVQDSRAIREYFDKCHELRRQFMAIMPERAFLEFQQIVQYF